MIKSELYYRDSVLLYLGVQFSIMKKSKIIKRTSLWLLGIMILTLVVNFCMAAILKPSTNSRSQSITCLQYLTELFARGTPIIQEGGLHHRAFGIYDDQLVSKVEGLKKVESSVSGIKYQRFYEKNLSSIFW